MHGGRRGGVRENSQLDSMEGASPEAFLADNSLVRACGHCLWTSQITPILEPVFFRFLG